MKPCCFGWASEKKAYCQHELHGMFGGTEEEHCVFGNIMDVVSSDLAIHIETAPVQQLFDEEIFRTEDISMECRCTTPGHRTRGCKLRPCTIHVAGTTCTDHTTFGKCERDEGVHMQVSPS